MNSSEIKEKIRILNKESEDKKHERKVLATDYEKQKEMVKKSGVTALLSFLIHYVLLVPVMDNTKHVTIAGMARFLSPFLMIIFFVSFVYFLIKGFDFFVNADTKYSKVLAKKLKSESVSEELRLMNETITMLDIEINRLENELYESGEDLFDETSKNTVKNKMMAGEIIERKVINRTAIESRKVISEIEKDIKVDLKAYTEEDSTLDFEESNNTKKNDINALLNGLDDFALDDYDDELESSSELWEKDAMRRFSRY